MNVKQAEQTHLTWDLESIFPNGSASVELRHFLDQLTADFTAAEAREPLPPLSEATHAVWIETINNRYDLGVRLVHASAFIGCLMSQDVRDEAARQLSTETDQLGARLGALWTRLSAAMADQPDEAWQQLVSTPDLAAVAFHLSEQRDDARDKLDVETEAFVNALAADGYHAWGKLYNFMAGDRQVEFEGETLSLGQLQSKFMDAPQRETRQRAFERFEQTWAELAQTSAMALNYQAGFRLTLYKQRGWDSVLRDPLKYNRLAAETLEAMWSVIDRKADKLLPYFAAKAKLLGVEQLAWYDVVAPIGDVTRQFSYPEAADFVVENVGRVNPDIADFCRSAVDKRWVEAEDRAGKRAGAYCTRLPLLQEPRIFMTYNGSFNQMLTLAHELGHGYHGWVMRDLPYGAQRYTMSVAETASTLNELIVKDAAIQTAASEADKLSILGAKLSDASTFLMNIRARYLFETAFFDQRAHKQLSVDDLSALMVAAQKEAYKEGLSEYHPLFWCSKLHFYITQAPFYNFPYTFGYLFSNGVYTQATAEGQDFVGRYRALLRDTGSMTTEALAHKHLGVDLTQASFWETAVDRVLADVDEFVALVG